MSIRGRREQQPVFGATNPAEAQPGLGSIVSMGMSISQAHQPSYPGYPAGVNPGFDPRIVQFNSAPTVPQTSGQSGEPMPSGYNKDPRDKKRGKWIIGGVAAVAALGIAAGVVKVATEPSDKSTESPSAGSGTSTSEVLYGQSCYDELIASGSKMSVNNFQMIGSSEDLQQYGLDGVLKVNLQKLMKDDDGETPLVSIPESVIQSATESLTRTVDSMKFKPGEIDSSGSIVLFSDMAIIKTGPTDGKVSDGNLAPGQNFCLYNTEDIHSAG